MSLGVDGDDDSLQIGLRALAHPVRLRILSLLVAAPMTAAEVARELGLTHANASYHLRQLAKAGTIDVLAHERIRGGEAKRYRYLVDRPLPAAVRKPGAGTADGSEQRLLYAAVAAELCRRSEHLKRSRHSHLTDAELWVDPQDWVRFRDRVVAETMDLHRAARPARSPGTVRISTTVVLFEMSTG